MTWAHWHWLRIPFAIVVILSWVAGLWLFGVGIHCLWQRRRPRQWPGLWLAGNAVNFAGFTLIVIDSRASHIMSARLLFSGPTLTMTFADASRLVCFCGSLLLLSALARYWATRSGKDTILLPLPERAARRKFRRIALAGLTLSVCALLAFTRWHITAQAINPQIQVLSQTAVNTPKSYHSTDRLHSREPYQAVRVPFNIDAGGQIRVRVSMGDKNLNCIVDTGTEAILIPASAGVGGLDMKTPYRATDIHGTITMGQQIALPHLTLGDYELQNVPVAIMPATDASEGAETPTLGDAAFSHTVLTIDFRHRQLTVRRPQYDFTKDKKSRNGLILDFVKPEADWSSDDRNVPIVVGALRGRHCGVLFDTGWSNNLSCMGITPQSGITASAATGYGLQRVGQKQFKTGCVHDVVCTLIETFRGYNVQTVIQASALMYPKSSWGYGVNLGLWFLKNYRITIDYPRRRVLLEPYSLPERRNPDGMAGDRVRSEAEGRKPSA